jgi:WD40 repeat protein
MWLLKVIWVLVLVGTGFTAQLIGKIDAQHAVTDMVYKNGILYVSTEQGEVKIYELDTAKLVKRIELPSIRDFMGSPIPPKVYSVDVSPSGNKILIVSEASGGFSEVYVYTEGKGLDKLIDLGWNLIIKKGRFVDENKVLLGLLGDEIALLDLGKRKFIYRVQIGRSSLSDISLSEDRKRVAISDEAGIVTLASVENGKVLRKFKGINVDKLYGLDYRDNKIMVGGRDRRVALYYTDGKRPKRFNAKFLVFSVAMNRDATVGAYLYNERNDVRVIELDTGRELDLLKGHEYPVSVMLFLDGTLLAGCDDGKIFVWRLQR